MEEREIKREEELAEEFIEGLAGCFFDFRGDGFSQGTNCKCQHCKVVGEADYRKKIRDKVFRKYKVSQGANDNGLIFDRHFF